MAANGVCGEYLCGGRKRHRHAACSGGISGGNGAGVAAGWRWLAAKYPAVLAAA